MGRKRTLTKRASYRDGVDWIAQNDDAGDDANRLKYDVVEGYISTQLLAALFGAPPTIVAIDIVRRRATLDRAAAQG